jgi:pyridoxal biosynthesis lyase PdxS
VRGLDEPGTDDLADLLAAARDRGFQVLVETHTVEELERALAAGADVVGVNNRDLARLEVDLGTFESVAPAVERLAREHGRDPENVTLIAESGIATTRDVERMRTAGADALLVGSAIMDVSGGPSDRGGSDAGVVVLERPQPVAGLDVAGFDPDVAGEIRHVIVDNRSSTEAPPGERRGTRLRELRWLSPWVG